MCHTGVCIHDPVPVQESVAFHVAAGPVVTAVTHFRVKAQRVVFVVEVQAGLIVPGFLVYDGGVITHADGSFETFFALFLECDFDHAARGVRIVLGSCVRDDFDFQDIFGLEVFQVGDQLFARLFEYPVVHDYLCPAASVHGQVAFIGNPDARREREHLLAGFARRKGSRRDIDHETVGFAGNHVRSDDHFVQHHRRGFHRQFAQIGVCREVYFAFEAVVSHEGYFQPVAAFGHFHGKAALFVGNGAVNFRRIGFRRQHDGGIIYRGFLFGHGVSFQCDGTVVLRSRG